MKKENIDKGVDEVIDQEPNQPDEVLEKVLRLFFTDENNNFIPLTHTKVVCDSYFTRLATKEESIELEKDRNRQ